MAPKRRSANLDYDALDYAYDVLDRVKDRRGPAAAIDTAWAMVQAGQDIEAGRAVVTKSAAGAVGIAYKQAPGMTTLELPAGLASEIVACMAKWGNTPFEQMLRQARGGQATTGAQVSDTEKPAATLKAAAVEAELAKTATIFDDAGRPLVRPLYDAKGNLLP